jgi:RNA processing factor Prp31
VGIARATYYRWCKDDPEFADACSEAIDQSVGTINDMAESQLISAIRDKNMTAISFWLRHHHRSYETRIKLDGRITHEAEALSPDQEALVSKALRLVGMLKETNTHVE